MTSHSRQELIVLYCAFLLSGFAGLVYEVVWVRLFTGIFGSTTYAVSTVLTAFMAGLAIGSYFFGKMIDRSRSILLVYAFLEIGIGLTGITLPFMLEFLKSLSRPLISHLMTEPVVLSLFRFLLSFGLMIIPTMFMGATLPVLGRFLVRQGHSATRHIGRLYALNTFGATVGCLVAGFWLINLFGLTISSVIAALVNLFAALLVLFVLRPFRTVKPAPPHQISKEWGDIEPVEHHQVITILALFFLSGFTALAYEILWMRILSLILGCSTYAFTIMLTIFLAGIALGGALFARSRTRISKGLFWFGIIELGIGIVGLVGFLLYNILPDIFLSLFVWLGYGLEWGNVLSVQFLVSGLILFPLTLLYGLTFPLVTGFLSTRSDRVGNTIGTAYAVNTLGAISGSLLTGFFLLPLLGTLRSLLIIVIINCFIGVFALSSRSGNMVKIVAAGLCVFLCLTVIFINVPAPDLFAMGVFDARRFISRDGVRHAHAELEKYELLYFREGATASVAVFQDRHDEEKRELKVNGKSVAGSRREDIKHLKLLGHLPMMLHPHPDDVLVIGLGMGITAGAASLYDPKHLSVIEISPEVAEATHYFAGWNHHVLSFPGLDLVFADGKNYVEVSEQFFDVITADPIHPWVTGSSDLYSTDHYLNCKNRLKEGGIFCQWLPLYQLSEHDIRVLLSSFRLAFPHGSLWITEFDGILIGTEKPLGIDITRLDEWLQNNDIQTDLIPIHKETTLSILGCYLLGPDEIEVISRHIQPNTFDHPRIEFSAPKSMYATTQISNLRMLFQNRTPANNRFNRKDLTIHGLDRVTELPLFVQANDNITEGSMYFEEGNQQHAETLLRDALNIWPDLKEARYLLSRILYNSAYQASQKGDIQTVLDLYNKALEFYPEESSPETFNYLGFIHYRLSNREEAQMQWTKAIELDPGFWPARENLANLMAEKGQRDQALSLVSIFLIEHPEHDPAQKLHQRLQAFRVR